MKNKGPGKLILFYLVFFVAIVLVANFLVSNNGEQKKIDYKQVVTMFQKEQVKRFYIDKNDVLYLSKKEDKSNNDKKVNLSTFEYSHALASEEQTF